MGEASRCLAYIIAFGCFFLFCGGGVQTNKASKEASVVRWFHFFLGGWGEGSFFFFFFGGGG